MNRNDYRRALIMLRGLSRGYSGHVRLERRTLQGVMQFTVYGASGNAPLYGVVMGRRQGQWHAMKLGQLRCDRQNQAGLLASFDPRNMNGAELEDYDLVGVADPSDPKSPLVLSGFLNGSKEVNWVRVREAVARLFAESSTQEPVTALPAQEETESEPAQTLTVVPQQDDEAENNTVSNEQEEKCDCEDEDDLFEETIIEAFTIPPIEAAEPIEVFAQTEPMDQAEQERIEASEQAQVEQIGVAEADGAIIEVYSATTSSMQSVGFQVETENTDGTSEDSALILMDPEIAWPESILALRPLFEQNPAFEPFPTSGYVFVRAPLPGSDSDSHCAIGLKAVEGSFRVLCYAVPGTFALEPPVGMEGYSWRGSGSQGYWITCIDLETGEPYEGDEP